MSSEIITDPFSGRCKEYQDAGIPLYPSNILTVRSTWGAFNVTAHIFKPDIFCPYNCGGTHLIYLN